MKPHSKRAVTWALAAASAVFACTMAHARTAYTGPGEITWSVNDQTAPQLLRAYYDRSVGGYVGALYGPTLLSSAVTFNGPFGDYVPDTLTATWQGDISMGSDGAFLSPITLGGIGSGSHHTRTTNWDNLRVDVGQKAVTAHVRTEEYLSEVVDHGDLVVLSLNNPHVLNARGDTQFDLALTPDGGNYFSWLITNSTGAFGTLTIAMPSQVPEPDPTWLALGGIAIIMAGLAGRTREA